MNELVEIIEPDGQRDVPFPTWLRPSARVVQPDVSLAITFFATLFPKVSGQSIHFRAVPEPRQEGKHPRNLHYALDENFSDTLKGFLEWCAIDNRAAFFLPGIVKGQGTGKADVLSLPAILVDFDRGNPDENLRATEELVGPATIVVESGGHTDSGPKLHAYWRLREVAAGFADIQHACAIRETLARKFGGDPAFKQAAQVIRIPGSIWSKGDPKLVKLRTVRPEASYDLNELAAKLGDNTKVVYNRVSDNTNVVGFSSDFSRDKPLDHSVERALTQVTHEGAVDDLTRFEAAGKAIGHFVRMVREGKYTREQAWEATQGWNQANLAPPWDEERLRNDFERLVRIDVEAHGPFLPAEAPIVTGAPSDWSLEDWSLDRFAGTAPVRKWLVEGLIPSGTAGVFAAVGDAGKSMMALWLAYVVGCYPDADPMGISAPRFFGQPVTRRGAAVVLTAEDDEGEVWRRIEKLDSAGLRLRGKQRVYVVPMPSVGGVRAIMEETPVGPRPTAFWEWFRAKLAAITDLALVVIDPLASFVDADVERDNRTGAQLMTMLAALAQRSGAAVMLTHHLAKGSQPDGLGNAREAIRGAGALVNNGRWALAMWEADKDQAKGRLKSLGQDARAKQAGIVYFGGLAKGNAPGAKILRTLVRNGETGLLEDVTDAVRAGTPAEGELDDMVSAALKKKRLADLRFDFGASKGPLEAAWKVAFDGKAPAMSREAREEQFWRLVARGDIVQTDQKRGGHSVYTPKVD